MKKSLFELYSLVVCVIAIIIIIIHMNKAILNCVKMTNPGSTMSSHQLNRYLNNDTFIRRWKPLVKKKYTDEEITNMREKEYKLYLDSQSRRYKLKFIESLLFFISGLILFIVHWIFAKRERKKNE